MAISESGHVKKDGEDDIVQSFQPCVLDHIQETVLMYIHSSFFAQAIIIEQPVNPLKSAYASPFLAAYHVSSTILKRTRKQSGVGPDSWAKLWTFRTFAFWVEVIFGSVSFSILPQEILTKLADLATVQKDPTWLPDAVGHLPQNQHQWQNRPQQYAPLHHQQQPAFRTQMHHLPNSELADGGLTTRDSRLDECRSLFTQGSGLLAG